MVESKDEPARSVSSSEHIVVRAPAYFKELFKLIEGTDARYATLATQMNTQPHSVTIGRSVSRTVANYVQWRSVFSRITSLSRRFLYRYLDFARVSLRTSSSDSCCDSSPPVSQFGESGLRATAEDPEAAWVSKGDTVMSRCRFPPTGDHGNHLSDAPLGQVCQLR